MKKIGSKITKTIITFILLITCIFIHKSFADVGGIQRYDSSSSSSSSSSSWRDSSSYSSSSYGSSDSSSGSLSFGGLVILIIIFAIVMYLNRKPPMHPIQRNQVARNLESYIDDTKTVADKIREIDPAFSEDDFLAWVKEVFIKLQNAWTKREWAIIRPFESDELFQQHNTQLQELIEAGKTNIVERINVTKANLYNFTQDGDKEIVRVTLHAVMRDYIIDDSTKQVLEGNPNIDQYMTYRLTFMRKVGVKTKVGTAHKSTTNCPNCDAPTNVTSSGKCEYCGSIITTGEHDWVLANLEGVR